MILRGTVLRVEPINGTSADGSSYAYMRAHVLDGVEVYPCRVANDWPGSIPGAGEDLAAEVNVTAYPSRGSARLSITLLRPAVLAPAA